MMSPADVERIYDALAESIDAMGPDKTPLMLAKLCLALGHDVGDADRVLTRIAECAEGL